MLSAASCEQGLDGPDDLTVKRGALETGLATGAGLDSLTTYAARCEAATAIHVPTINCLAGVEIPQGSSFDAVEVDLAIPSGTIGERTVKPPLPEPPNAPANLVQNIQARGTIGGTSDSFFYSYATHSGNGDTEAGSGTIEVKVNSLTNTNANAKAGLMLRHTTAPNSAFVMIAVTPGRSVVFQSRTTTGGTMTTHATTQMASFPIWLRLMWDGAPSGVDQVRTAGAVSSDGVTWTPFGDITYTRVQEPPGVGVPFPFEGLMGLAVASHNAASTTTAAFDKFVTSKYCDRPNVLEGRCDPRSTFQVAAETSDAIVVANCRKGGSIDPGSFKDMAVIQYNRQNGAICFYQSPQGTQNGTALTTPGLGNGTGQFPWLTPGATRDVGCTNCHDNGPFVRSLYLYQLSNFPTSGYNNNGNKLRYVGRDFLNDRSWWISAKPDFDSLQDPDDEGPPCTSCHTLSTNNVPVGSAGRGGSAFDLAQIATAPSWTSKNPNSVQSPIWMRPDQNTFYAPAQASAANWGTCAQVLAAAGYDPSGPGVAESNCAFTPNGVPYEPTLVNTNDSNIGTTGGSATGSLEFSTLIAPADTDVYGNSDKFFWTYAVQGGDGAAVVKVTRLDASNPYAKAGIMVRNGTGANAVNVMIAVTATEGATFQYRPTAGAATTTAYLTPRSVPIWLRLARSGRTWVGSVSTDAGNSWTQVGQPVTLVDLVTDLVGLVATSHNPNQTNRADFESFEWTPATGWTQPGDPHILVDGSIGASTGSRTERRGEETIVSSGGDIYGTSDAFQYAFKTFGGDGVLITQVTSQVANSGTIDPYAKAGIMFRETAAANSPNVFLGKTPSGATVQQRVTAGGSTNVTNVSAAALPLWFRLIRTRNTFIGSMSTDKVNWTQVGDPVVFTNFLSSPLVGLAVSSHSSNAVTAKLDTQAFQPPGMEWTYGLSGLQSPWLDATMGMTGGSHTRNTGAGTETIVASGADIYGNSDQFFFAFQNVTGNARITAKVDSLALVTPPSGTINPYAKAGIMFRDSATGGSPNAFMAITAAQGSTFQYRSTAGGNTPAPVFQTGAAPYWVRVTRTGTSNNVYTGYRSSNGTTWTQVGSVTMSTIGQTALVGMAVTSHDASRSVTATFSNVLIEPL
jgi:hypothetical protein